MKVKWGSASKMPDQHKSRNEIMQTQSSDVKYN